MSSTGLLLLLLPAVVFGDILDYKCGSTVSVYSFTDDTYSIDSGSIYTSPCNVQFQRYSEYGEIQLTVTGYDLKSSQCQVNVLDSSQTYSKTYGNIDRSGSFSQTVQSTDGTGELWLRVTGSSCDSVTVSFTVSKLSCPGFTCSNGQCKPESDVCDDYDDCDDGSDELGCYYFWTTGTYIGVSLGIFGLLLVVSSISAVLYRRRRVVLVRSAGVITAGQTVITQSRW
ncbi:uncharacterized protein LOC143283952 [Babylonia areolata]|uniref:uncharacterized protein LOC143283952 n=1 Tax=Babylonia areolata TaxID=304850 RepID=UPI003FD298CB